MATSREERMQQRMRGAGRHEVADESFGFVLPGAEESPDVPPPAPAIQSPAVRTRSEPNISAKRKILNPTPSRAESVQPRSSASRSSARLSANKSDPYNVLEEDNPGNVPEPPTATSPVNEEPHDDSRDLAYEPQTTTSPVNEEPQDDSRELAHEPQTTTSPVNEESQVDTSPAVQEQQDEGDTPESLPAVVQRPASRDSVVSRSSVGPMGEEVTESPAAAPGSGHRRRIRVTNAAATQSAKLQRAVMEEDAGATVEMTTSSPLARKTKKSGKTASGLSARSTRAAARASLSSPIAEEDEIAPLARSPRKSDETATTRAARPTRRQNRSSTPSTIMDELSSPPEAAGTTSPKKSQRKIMKAPPVAEVPEPEEGEEQEAEADEEEAEAINEHEAARKIGRKRPRVSPPRQESPELHSQMPESVRPVKKRRQKRTQDRPAQQLQPKPHKKKNKPPTRRESDGGAVPIMVQRYTKRLQRNEDDTDEDILQADIPYVNRSGVNVIDVLSQMCDEVIEASQEKLQEAAMNTEDSSTRKEFRTKLRALEAFQEELRTRFLTQTIALDTMHGLQKRVRSVQKEKLALRTEILRIRAEREQVALKMDAVRVRHETANKESSHQLGLSSAMDAIDLAIDNGLSAPKLSAKEEKAAELANLELMVSKVASQASVADGGGNLKQIRDFNAFLERTAAALEGR